jgi:hypothetical protein
LQEDHNFEVKMGYIARLYFPKQAKKSCQVICSPSYGRLREEARGFSWTDFKNSPGTEREPISIKTILITITFRFHK